ncbi:S-adenosyl-L-methionine-dependent methyltransferase [Tribonema minus]|uniref:DNA (cytosine-5-)-methyltransferase n=1 Tax=Tribonema minus TaxID=303371 RepID=A0A835YWN5_9STRA|nr:S-adenosyl-L-methionine-dependent methyltransferase [Tribonema minus]
MIYVIDLFCGAGGFSEGASRAGAVVILAVDCWKAALDVHAANHGDCEHWNEPLGGDPAQFVARLRRVVSRRVPCGGLVHLHGSPPCQNLSSVNCMRNEREGMRLVEWTFAVGDLLQPDSFTVEQVPNAALLREYGHLPHSVYAMSEHGIPQSRRRVIFGNAPQLPRSSGADIGTILRRCDAAGCSAFAAGHRCRGAYVTRRLQDVSYTVTRNFPVMFDDGRMTKLPLTVMRELQTFPPSYKWHGSIGQQRIMIANALPPKFARQLVRHLEGTSGALATCSDS